jgi:hypothetical protein
MLLQMRGCAAFLRVRHVLQCLFGILVFGCPTWIGVCVCVCVCVSCACFCKNNKTAKKVL